MTAGRSDCDTCTNRWKRLRHAGWKLRRPHTGDDAVGTDLSMVDQAADGGHGGGFVREHLVSLAERLVGGDISNERPS